MKRFTYLRKRCLACVGVAALLLIPACAKQAEAASPTMQLDMAQMVATAKQGEDAPKSPLNERLGAPARVHTQLTDADGKMRVTVDAAVTLPNAEGMPIYRVQPGEFTAEYAQPFYQYFCGDTKMYAYGSMQIKGEIRGRIDSIKAAIASGNFPDGDDNADYWLKAYEDDIKRLEKALLTAPETFDEPASQVTLLSKREDGLIWPTFYVREFPQADRGKSFSVYGNMRTPTGEVMYVPDQDVTHAPRNVSQIGYGHQNLAAVSPQAVRALPVREVIGGQTAELPLSPIAAQQQAEALLSELNIADMEAYSVRLSAYQDEKGNATGNFRYSVDFRRVVDGVQVLSPWYYSSVGDPLDGCEWNYETLSVGICNGGIDRFSWEAPLNVGERLVESAELLPFDTILNVFEKMMCAVNAPTGDNIRCDTWHITDITLSLQRISEQDSLTDGLLIPVWSFYGTGERELTDGNRIGLASSFDPLGKHVLIINAVDGSVIDPATGH